MVLVACLAREANRQKEEDNKETRERRNTFSAQSIHAVIGRPGSTELNRVDCYFGYSSSSHGHLDQHHHE